MHEPAQNCKTVQFFGEKYALKLFVTLKMGTFFVSPNPPKKL